MCKFHNKKKIVKELIKVFFFLKQRQRARTEVELEMRGLRRRNSFDMDSVRDDNGPGIQVYRPTNAGLLPLGGSRGSIGSNSSYELFVRQSSVPNAR
jgi:hypothetical protein